MEDEMQKSLQYSVNKNYGVGVRSVLFQEYVVCEPIERGASGYVYRIEMRKNKKSYVSCH